METPIYVGVYIYGLGSRIWGLSGWGLEDSV